MNKFESDAMAAGDSGTAMDSMLRRFKKRVIEDEILDEVRRRQYFMKKSVKRKEKSKRARLREIKAQRKQREF